MNQTVFNLDLYTHLNFLKSLKFKKSCVKIVEKKIIFLNF